MVVVVVVFTVVVLPTPTVAVCLLATLFFIWFAAFFLSNSVFTTAVVSVVVIVAKAVASNMGNLKIDQLLLFLFCLALSAITAVYALVVVAVLHSITGIVVVMQKSSSALADCNPSVRTAAALLGKRSAATSSLPVVVVANFAFASATLSSTTTIDFSCFCGTFPTHLPASHVRLLLTRPPAVDSDGITDGGGGGGGGGNGGPGPHDVGRNMASTRLQRRFYSSTGGQAG